MRISEADPTEDDLLLKGSEERGEAVAALPFPSLPFPSAGRGERSSFRPSAAPCAPLPGAGVCRSCRGDRWDCGSPTARNMPCPHVFRGWLAGREK